MTSRVAKISSRRRRAKFQTLAARDGKVCWYCGKVLVFGFELGEDNPQPDHDPRPIATIDHLRPISQGGSNENHNLILACRPCHNERHSP